MIEFINYIRKNDPAKPSFLEVLIAYNGFHAIGLHRFNHVLWHAGLHALARFFANFSRVLTGVEIHPEAKIGKFVFIDHGTGVVIGQTAVVGDYVTIYHGVTLGGISSSGEVEGKRHPTVEEGAVIGAGAQVLGNITVGKSARIGANSVVLKDVSEGCTVVGNPARLVHCPKSDTQKSYGIAAHTVDPVAEAINGLMADVRKLKEQAGIKDAPANDENYADQWMGSGI